MLAANLGCLINVAVLVGYFIIANETRAWPSTFIIWAWIPFVAHFLLYHFFDGVQNTTRNIARVYLLQRDGLNYSHATIQEVWQALIPIAYAPLMILWKLSTVASFVCLLLLQGWPTAIIAHAAITLFGGLVPINYQRHLERIQSSFPQTLSPQDVVKLAYFGVSLTELRLLIDQAVDERRDPQKWWGEVMHDTTARTIDEQEGS